MSQGFRDLEVWKKSMEFTETVYRLSSGFPSHEQFGLTCQVRRAAVSIASCIAEGHARFSRRDFARFVSMAMGSLAESKPRFSWPNALDTPDRTPSNHCRQL